MHFKNIREMKHIRIVLLMAFFSFVTASYGQTREKAKKAVIDDVALSKKSLPYTKTYLTIVDMEIKGNAYITYYVVDDKETDYNEYMRNLRKHKTDSFVQTAKNHPMFARNLVVAGLNMVMVIKAKSSGKTESVTLMSNELKNALLDYIKSTQ